MLQAIGVKACGHSVKQCQIRAKACGHSANAFQHDLGLTTFYTRILLGPDLACCSLLRCFYVLIAVKIVFIMRGVCNARARSPRDMHFIYATRLSRDYRATAYARLPRDMMKDRAHFLSPEADI